MEVRRTRRRRAGRRWANLATSVLATIVVLLLAWLLGSSAAPTVRILAGLALLIAFGALISRATYLRAKHEAAIAELARYTFHDVLTDLPNRALFGDRLAHALQRRQSPGVAIVVVDLDHFRVVNDSLGHTAGDRLLVAVASRLQEALPPDTTIARLGGDEFAIVVEEADDPTAGIRTAEQVLGGLAQPFRVASHELVVTASIGVAHGARGAQPEELLRQADAALYQAKGEGRSGYTLADPELAARARERLALERDLRLALAREELSLYFQPQVEASTGLLVGVEALARWTHPGRGAVFPSTFIPLAETTGLILPLGEWVLTTACCRLSAWRGRAPRAASPRVAVNLSLRQLRDPNLVACVRQVLDTAGLPSSCLELELTETMALEDIEATVAVLRALKSLGVRIALDDFGTGSSSLHALQRLPLDTLKIDRSIVTAIGEDRKALGVLQAVVALGRQLGLQVVAEGVETAEQLRRVRESGAAVVQGYYFARPMPLESVAGMVNQERCLRPTAA